METRRKERIAEASRERTEEELEDERKARAREDELIQNVERDFWEHTKRIQDGVVEPVLAECRSGPGIPVGAPTLDSVISDDQLDRLLEFFENGGSVDLSESSRTNHAESTVLSNGMPSADQETIEKAEHVLKLLTAQMEQLDAKSAEVNKDLAKQLQDEKEALAKGQPCELERMLIEKRQAEEAERAEKERDQAQIQTPEYTTEQSDHDIILRISMPEVTTVGDIDAEVVERSLLQIRVEGLYSLDYRFTGAVDDEQMSCRFEKLSKTLVIRMPFAS